MNHIANDLKKEFTITPNGLINDTSLDALARFLFVLMTSKPNDWRFYHESLQKEVGIKDPRTFRKYMDQLVDRGWVSRKRNKKGTKFDNYSYTLHSSVQILHSAKNAPYTKTNLYTVEKSLDDVSKIPYKEIIEHLNQQAGKNYRYQTKATQRHIKARWNEGFRLDDFIRAIDAKVKEWLGTKNEKYLRPETLFGNKMEGYAQQEVTPDVDNSLDTVIDMPLTEAQFDKYCTYHNWVKDTYPKLFKSVRIVPASDYFDITKGGKRFDLLRIHYLERDLKKRFQLAHQQIEAGLAVGNDYPGTMHQINNLFKIRTQC